jgi:uncharacterized flavoprotein (TIGR03862 family)
MAAEVLAGAGMAVTVHEHMASVGRKLLLAGRGGLNLTHSEPVEQLLGRYGDGEAADRVRAAVRAFGANELRDWSASLGQPTFVGSSGRVFPEAFRATPLLRAWLERLSTLGVAIRTRERWLGWAPTPDGRIDERRLVFQIADGSKIEEASDVAILALGGASWPRVGSNGGWVETLRLAGVEVAGLRPSNCGVLIEWSASFVERFAGVPLKNVAIGVGGVWVRGDAMVTDDGLEGGPVYAHSRAIRERIDRTGRCTVEIDLHPDLVVERIGERLATRRSKDSFSTSMRRTLGLAPVSASLLHEACTNGVPTDTSALAALIKAVPLVVRSTMPIERAISSAGGVTAGELDGAFMLHRLPGTFVAGEMIDGEAPTGGYLLQSTFSTAVAAARGASAWLEDARDPA